MARRCPLQRCRLIRHLCLMPDQQPWRCCTHSLSRRRRPLPHTLCLLAFLAPFLVAGWETAPACLLPWAWQPVSGQRADGSGLWGPRRRRQGPSCGGATRLLRPPGSVLNGPGAPVAGAHATQPRNPAAPQATPTSGGAPPRSWPQRRPRRWRRRRWRPCAARWWRPRCGRRPRSCTCPLLSTAPARARCACRGEP